MRIKDADDYAFTELCNYYKVKAIIESSVRTVHAKNTQYELRNLRSILLSELFVTIYEHYKSPEDMSKSNNWVLSYLAKVAKSLLYNYIKKDKNMYRNSEGTLTLKLPKVPETVSANLLLGAITNDKQASIGIKAASEIDYLDQVDCVNTIMQVEKVNLCVRKLLKKGKVSYIDLVVFLYYYTLSYQTKEIVERLNSRFELKESDSTVNHKKNKVLKLLIRELVDGNK